MTVPPDVVVGEGEKTAKQNDAVFQGMFYG